MLPPWPALVELATKFIIYALIDPRFNTVWYIGKSCGGFKRPREHAWYAQNGRNVHDLRHCYNWIRQLQGLRLEYKIVVLEVVEAADRLAVYEQWWIEFARAWGCRLTNLTDGGEGMLGFHPTSATRMKMSAAAMAAGARFTVKVRRGAAIRIALAHPEVKARQRAGLITANARSVVQERHRAGSIAAYTRPEVQARHLTTNARPEVKARRHAAAVVANARPEVKARIRAAMVAARARPEVKVRHQAASERAGRIRAATYRRLIAAMPDATNAQIYSAVVAELGVDRAGPSRYTTWYREQLRRQQAASC